MTLLIRNLQSIKAWIIYGDLSVQERNAQDLPLSIARDFIPSERDNECLSLFEVADETEALAVAAAFAFGEEKLDGGRYNFASAVKDSLVNDQFEIVRSAGRLSHKFADSHHVEIRLSDLSSATRLARHFAEGELFVFEGKEVGRQARFSAQSDQFHYDHLSKISFTGNWQAKNLLRFIADKSVVVNGRPGGSKI